MDCARLVCGILSDTANKTHNPFNNNYRALPFSPTTPQNEAGILTEPPPSVPIATGQRPKKTHTLACDQTECCPVHSTSSCSQDSTQSSLFS